MDEYMDTLFDFMDPMSDTEMLMRQYYDYIATFDPKEVRGEKRNVQIEYAWQFVYLM